MLDKARTGWHLGAWDHLVRLADADGSAGQRHRLRLVGIGASARDLSDAVHALCAVHGQHPGLPAAALAHCAQPDACDWIGRVADAFAAERAYLAQLAAAAGPVPSTPGQAESQAALIGQHHALDMLARSDRRGCATGAVAALVLDWQAIRAVLDTAAIRFGVEVAPSTLPDDAEAIAQLDAVVATPAVERALGFGAAQLLAQHRGLWDLLDVRAGARDAA